MILILISNHLSYIIKFISDKNYNYIYNQRVEVIHKDSVIFYQIRTLQVGVQFFRCTNCDLEFNNILNNYYLLNNV